LWLLQGERDGDADQVEGLALGAGRLGEHRDVGVGAGEADLVAGQGGQVLEQAAEAVVGPAGSCWREALAWAWPERRAGAPGLAGAGGLSSAKVSGARPCGGARSGSRRACRSARGP